MKLRKRMKKMIVLILAVTVLLGMFAHHPVILRDPELSDAYQDAVQDQARGVYSKRLPLVPMLVIVENLREQTVRYTVYYFPFGSVGMSYHPANGYNIEKPLTGM